MDFIFRLLLNPALSTTIESKLRIRPIRADFWKILQGKNCKTLWKQYKNTRGWLFKSLCISFPGRDTEQTWCWAVCRTPLQARGPSIFQVFYQQGHRSRGPGLLHRLQDVRWPLFFLFRSGIIKRPALAAISTSFPAKVARMLATWKNPEWSSGNTKRNRMRIFRRVALRRRVSVALMCTFRFSDLPPKRHVEQHFGGWNRLAKCQNGLGLLSDSRLAKSFLRDCISPFGSIICFFFQIIRGCWNFDNCLYDKGEHRNIYLTFQRNSIWGNQCLGRAEVSKIKVAIVSGHHCFFFKKNEKCVKFRNDLTHSLGKISELRGIILSSNEKVTFAYSLRLCNHSIEF